MELVEDTQSTSQSGTDSSESALSLRIVSIDIVDDPPPSYARETQKDYCTVRFVGRTKAGETACIWAQGFYPYFFLQLPASWREWKLADMKTYITTNGGRNMEHNLVECTIQMSHETFCFSDGRLSPFLKLSFRGTKSLNACKKLFNEPIRISEDDDLDTYTPCEIKGVPIVLKCLHDTNIQPGGWITVDRSKVQFVRGESTCHYNVHAQIGDVHPLACDDFPPFVEMSFDCEMHSPTWDFPRAEGPYDYVTQIAIEFSRFREPKPYRHVLICWGEMGDLSSEDIEVRLHATEREALLDFKRLVLLEDVDIWTGFNISNFDIPYIINRGKLLNLPKDFFVFGRFPKEPTEIKESYRSRQDRAEGIQKKIKYDVPIIPGCRIEDCHDVTKKFLRYKANDYKLETIATEILGYGKHGVTPEDIFRSYQDIADRLAAQRLLQDIQPVLSELRILHALALVVKSLQATNGTSSVTLDSVIDAVCEKWPVAHRPVVQAFLQASLSRLSIPTDANGATVIEAINGFLVEFIDHHNIGDAILFQNVRLDLHVNWFRYGTTLAQLLNMSQSAREDASQIEYNPKLNDVKKPPEPKTKKGAEAKKRPAATDPTELMPVSDSVEGEQDACSILALWERRATLELDIVNYILENRCSRRFAEKWWRLRQDLSVSDSSSESFKEATTLLESLRARERAFLLSEKSRVGKYCLMDANLPWGIRKKKQHLIAICEMARVAGVPANLLMEKGETIKVLNLIIKWARANNYVCTVRYLPKVHFKGASVLTPLTGFYREIVATLDFSR